MSEKLKNQFETGGEHQQERLSQAEALSKKSEKETRSSRHEHKDNLEKIRSKVESESKHTKESASKHKHDKKETERPVLINKELKGIAYQRTLKRTRSKLPAPARAFSRIVHQPAIEAVSEVAGKTIARPSGVLAGGIFAFLSSSAFLWIARHYGYEYNYLLFALFFVGGFIVGIGVEFGIKLANRKS